MLFKVPLAASFAASAVSVALPKRQSSVWSLENFDSLVTFGDSYTDENRLNYFLQNKGNPPPPGTYFPEGLNTASGGRTWPRFVVEMAAAGESGTSSSLTLYDYAVSGAVCSNEITPRYELPRSRFLTDMSS